MFIKIKVYLNTPAHSKINSKTNPTTKATRPKEVKTDVSCRPPNLSSASSDLELSPFASELL